jgi:hypothetical protein
MVGQGYSDASKDLYRENPGRRMRVKIKLQFLEISSVEKEKERSFALVIEWS